MKAIAKLDLSKFRESDRALILEFGTVMAAQDLGSLERHLELAGMDLDSFFGDRFFNSQLLAATATMGLLAYAAPGLHALYRLAIRVGRASGNYDAPTAIMCAALPKPDVAVRWIHLASCYMNDDALSSLAARVRANCQDPEIIREARRLLSRLIHFFISEESRRDELGALMVTLPLAFGQAPQGESPATELMLHMVARSTLAITDEICDDLEELVSQGLDERTYQGYLKKHPALLDPLATSIVEGQNLGGRWRSDFVIRRLDDEYVFVEIEKPQDKPFTNYPHPSQCLSHALGQILNWLVWVEDNIAYAQSHGLPRIHQPRGVVVIGRSKNVREAQLRMLRLLNDTLTPRIRILTYDEVILNARNVVRNLTER